MTIHRRQLLATAAYIAAGTVAAKAHLITGVCPGIPMPARRRHACGRARGSTSRPTRPPPSRRSPTASSRPIRRRPAARTPAARSIIDRQLAGPYGRSEGDYYDRSVHAGHQGAGSAVAERPAKEYRTALAALDEYCRRASTAARHFAELSRRRQGRDSAGLESGTVKLDGADGKNVLRAAPQGYPDRASSPTRSTAATATWWPGR